MKTYEPSEERFSHDVRNHALIILRAAGVDRHLKFNSPNRSEYWFEIITWDGSLCINGDCGTYVFSRTKDMFQFFRAGGVRINPDYWSEKVTAADRDGVKVFNWDLFTADVKDYFEQRGSNDQDCWDAIEDALGACEPDEFGACQFIREFEHEGFQFVDWERTSEHFTFRFIWNCRAIVWAIRKFDEYAATIDASSLAAREQAA